MNANSENFCCHGDDVGHASKGRTSNLIGTHEAPPRTGTITWIMHPTLKWRAPLGLRATLATELIGHKFKSVRSWSRSELCRRRRITTLILGAAALLLLSGCQIATSAGGPATGSATAIAQVPTGIGIASPGTLHTVDSFNDVVRSISSTGAESIVAGNGTAGFTGDGAAATAAELNDPTAMDLDNTNDDVIADTGNNRIRIVAQYTHAIYGLSMTSGDIYTLAGNGTPGYSGDGGSATSAELQAPQGLLTDSSGNIVIADTGNDVIRAIAKTSGTFYGISMTTRDIYTIAGNGTAGYSGDSGPATAAELSDPSGLTEDGSGNILVADSGNSVIRVIAVTTGTFYGRSMTSGDIYTIAGNGSIGYSGDGGAATSAELDSPSGVGVDSSGNPLVADTGNNVVRVVSEVTGTNYGVSMTAGDIYTIAGNGTAGYSGDGAVATSAQLHLPTGATTDTGGNVIISDSGNDRIRVVDETRHNLFGIAMTAGNIYTVAGNGTTQYSGNEGPASNSQLSGPDGVAVDGSGKQVVADTQNNVIRVVANSTGTFYGQSMTSGDIYTVAGDGQVGYSGDGGPATSAELDYPTQVAVDGYGDIIISDTANCVVRVVANASSTRYGIPMTAGNIYTVAGNGTGGFSGDGGPGTSAELDFPTGVAVDVANNIFIVDTQNDVIRTIAASTGSLFGVSVNVGDIYTVAGDGTAGYSGDSGAALDAEFAAPTGLTVDGSGNLVVADTGNSVVRVVARTTAAFYGVSMSANDVYTVAGNGTFGDSGNGAAASAAEMNSPTGVAVDSSEDLIIADTGNNQLRAVPSFTGTYDGESVTADDIYALAGTGTAGYSGDGSSWNYELNNPHGLAFNSSGDLFVADTTNNRIRELTP